MADYGIQLLDPANGNILFSIDDSTMKDYGYVDISTNGNTTVPVTANTVIEVEDNTAPAIPPIVVLDIPNSRIVTSGGSGFNIRARLVDYR